MGRGGTGTGLDEGTRSDEHHRESEGVNEDEFTSIKIPSDEHFR